MKYFTRLVIVIILLTTTFSCTPVETKSEITVFCAAGLTQMVEQLAAEYEKNTGDKVVLNFASSGFLAKQLFSGSPADIYISANQVWMDEVVKKGLISKDGFFPFAKTSLVLIMNNEWEGELTKLEDLLNYPDIQIAFGDPSHVPVGDYAKQSLVSLGIWEDLQNNLIPSLSVQAAMMYAERGETDGAIIYQCDAINCKSSHPAVIIPDESHKPIVFLASYLKNFKSTKTKDFLNFLSSRNKEYLGKFGLRSIK